MSAFSLPPGADPLAAVAPLRNREPATAPATMTPVRDETLWIRSGSVLDFSGWRQTAVPAGSRGRVTISGRQMLEAGVPRRFNVAHLQPENTFTPIPAARAQVDAAMDYLARQGFNAIRVMGSEHWLMRGQVGAATFVADWWDRYEYMIASAKARGLYWILTVQSYNLFRDLNGQVSRYDYTSATNSKQRIFTEQEVRDNWTLGVRKLWDRVNPHTGIRILDDPALLMLEIYNESSAQFCGEKEVPPTWLTRTAGSTAAAQTWGEWLQDTTKAHGYANLAALNASWGTAHASYAAAAAQTPTLLELSVVAQTQHTIDWVLYTVYLETNLAAFYTAALDSLGYTGIRSLHTMYPSMGEIRSLQELSNVNHVSNWHNYDNLANGRTPPIDLQRAETPLWEYEYPALMHLWAGGSLPLWPGEGGSVTWCTWREGWPLVAAANASAGGVCMTNFIEGDPFTSSYFNDTTPHGDRIRILDNFAGPGGHMRDFVRVALAAIQLRADVSELSETGAVSIPLNDRFFGASPRNTGRIRRFLEGLYLPLYPLAGVIKTRLQYTADTSDDSLGATWYAKSWFTLLNEAVSAGAITTAHPSWVSANANRGTVTAIAVTGTVGGLVASASQPVLTLSAAHTLVDNDVIHVSNISGTAANNLRHNRTRVKVGTGNNIRCESGLNLTSYSGYATADWCEGANVLQSAHGEWGWSRRDKVGWINTARLKFFQCTTGVSLSKSYGFMTVEALTADCSVLAASADGLALTSSKRIILGLCGVGENTGQAFSDATRKVTTAFGTYPIQQKDATAQLLFFVSGGTDWQLYRLNRDGTRGSREDITQFNAGNSSLRVILRTGTTHPAMLWVLERP